jgi:hypothetical protein
MLDNRAQRKELDIYGRRQKFRVSDMAARMFNADFRRPQLANTSWRQILDVLHFSRLVC